MPRAERLGFLEVGVGLTGLCCGGARPLAERTYCSRGFDASWTVREPSSQRTTRALDWSCEGLLGE